MLDELTRDMLNRYVDGAINDAERQAFEVRLSREPALREAVARQRRIETALRRQFTAPIMPAEAIIRLAASVEDTPATAGRIDAEVAARATPQAKPQMNPWLRRLAVAAVLAAGLFGVWQTWSYLRPIDDGIAATPQLLTAAQYYNQKVAQGFEPLWVCDDDEEFAHTFQYRFGQPLLMKDAEREDVRMLGLDYTQVLSSSTVSMLGEAAGQRVLVIVDRIAADKPVQITSGCGSGSLHHFRREIGNLVIYEISPLDQPHFLNLLYQPEG